MNDFQFLITCKRTNNANNAIHYVKLGKQRRESSKHNYYTISSRLTIKAISITKLPNAVGSELLLKRREPAGRGTLVIPNDPGLSSLDSIANMISDCALIHCMQRG